MTRWLLRLWFPIAVVVLLLIALPELVLFGVNLAGEENRVNTWLEERYGLSFHVSLPTWAAGVLFAVPFALVLLYFLKLKRKPLSVPSTFLWKKSIEDLHVNSLFQWLRRNVLLLLQILAVLGLIGGVLAPRFYAKSREGRRYVVLIDNSASMSATDVAPSRLDAAKGQALAQVDAAADGDAGMVIAFGSNAEIRQSFTTNKRLLRDAVLAVKPTHRPTRIEEALTLAESLANPTRSTMDVAARPEGATRTYVPIEGVETDVHLYSDGRFPDAPDFALGNLRVQFHAAGKPGTDVNNVGIVGFSANRDEFDPTRLLVFVRLLNFRPADVRAKLEVQVFIDGKLSKAYEQTADLTKRVFEADKLNDAGEVVVAGKDRPGEATATFEVLDLDDRQEVVIRARLTDHKDEFAEDDTAWLVVGVVRKARVLIAGPANRVLDAFFDDPATGAVVDVVKIGKDDLGDGGKYLRPARDGAFDLVIFDRCGPRREDEMPQGNTLFIGYPPPPWVPPGQPQPAGKTVEKVEQPAVKGWVNQHGLLRYLTGLHEIGIAEGLRFTGLPPRTPRLMEGDRDLFLCFTLSRGPYTDAVLAFPILTESGEWNTNWPTLPSFPLFLRNAVYTLGNVRDATGEENTQPGRIKLLGTGGGVAKVTVTKPDGTTVVLERQTRADFPFGDTDLPGVYRAAWEGGGREFAVNLLDDNESNLQPRAGIRLGAALVKAGETEKQPRELWKWLVVAALGVVLVEWYVYNKRVFV